ncbi:Signal transduction histidine kinase [Actinacidiphila paucisporea]|uniref:histidine kinase n=1 Tax=Actinacidiphila paucisporea TaxID=310782 RepID=A0A1M7B265_9ACTN|nr:Signal transduction histidine kinase [Actinacidiphila paucisporea]
MSYEAQPGPPRRGRLSAGRGHRGGFSLWVPAVVLAFVQVVGSSVAGRHQTVRVDLDWVGYLLLLAGPALLLLRRRMPVAVAAGTAVVTLLYTVLGYPYGPVFASLVVAFFGAVAAGHRRAVLIVAGAAFAGHALVGEWLYRRLPPSGDGRTSWQELSGAAAWLLAVLAGAELFRVRRDQIAKERRERAAAEQRQVDEERMRIARELHDVLAHSISLINVQAGVALALMDERPEQARTALTTIKAASKEALGEVRQVLSTLRAPGEAPRAPAPGLDRLPELLEQATAAGLHAEVTVEGDAVPLPAGADLAAFRIIQEALTNIVRHSGSRTARIRLGYEPGSVQVRVDDQGPAAAGGEGGGNGLVGMRERAAALGGTVETGIRPDGGFRVLARLPLTAPEPPTTPASPSPGSAPAGPVPGTDSRTGSAPAGPASGGDSAPAGPAHGTDPRAGSTPAVPASGADSPAGTDRPQAASERPHRSDAAAAAAPAGPLGPPAPARPAGPADPAAHARAADPAHRDPARRDRPHRDPVPGSRPAPGTTGRAAGRAAGEERRP